MEPSKQELISIIVPVYNVEAYVGQCLASIVGQTYRNLEIILVDDGSEDRSPGICEEWARKDPRFRVIHKENGGLSDARNAGLRSAEGTLVGFVDSDDWIAPEMFQRLKEALDRTGSDIAACTVEMVWEDDAQPRRLLTVRENCLLDRAEAQEALLFETKLKQPVWYKLYRRHVLEDIWFETGKFHEDVFWSYRAIGRADRVCLIDYIGYYYRQRRNSIMGGSYSLRRLDAVEACCRRYEYIAEEFPSLKKEAKRRILAVCIYHGQMAMRFLAGKDREKAFACLEEVKRRYPTGPGDLADVSGTRRAWLILGRLSLRGTCMIRNFLKVGY